MISCISGLKLTSARYYVSLCVSDVFRNKWKGHLHIHQIPQQHDCSAEIHIVNTNLTGWHMLSGWATAVFARVRHHQVHSPRHLRTDVSHIMVPS